MRGHKQPMDKYSPINSQFFVWEAWYERMMTLDDVKRRGITMVNRCYLCQKEEENVSHLFLHCGKTG